MVWSINLDVSGTLCSNLRNHSQTVDFHPLFTVHNNIVVRPKIGMVGGGV